jgi:hypothetical protein
VSWYDTPNIHLCTIADFVVLAGERSGRGSTGPWRWMIGGDVREVTRPGYWDNLMAESAIFVLSRPADPQGPA